MTTEEALISVWKQTLVDGKNEVELGDEVFRVVLLRSKKLKMVDFTLGGFRIAGIEQNPNTASQWAKLAREGKRIVQFRCQGRYIANVCEGRLVRYPAWRVLELPE